MSTRLRPPEIRPVAAADEPAWRRLWAGYLAFYRQDLAADVTDALWARLLDPAELALFARVAEVDGEVAGIAHVVLHPGTWSLAPIAYLEDLFVDPAVRGRGIGSALIGSLVEEGRRSGWHRLYWRTRADNRTAQRAYARIAAPSDWIMYEVPLAGG